MNLSTYTILVPEYPSESIQGVRHWLESLREVKLMGQMKVQAIPWKEGVTGSEDDWFAVARGIQKAWEASEGILIWAPEQSLVVLAGFLRMVLPNPGKPIILFSADRPSQIEGKQLKKYALTSVLVNATYLASSNLAEVVILSEQAVYRPDGCFWALGQLGPIIQSVYEPLAKLQLSLQIHGDYHHRDNAALSIHPLTKLEDRIFHHHWQPSVPQTQSVPQDTRAVLLQAEGHYLGHPRLQQLADEIEASGAALLWYQEGAGGRGREEGGLVHPNAWWALLGTQVAFGLEQDQEKAQRLAKDLVMKTL